MESIAHCRVHNRVLAVMAHLTRYSFCPQARLALDAGVSPSTISRFLSGETNPSFSVVIAVTRALEQQLGKRLDPRELLSLDGTYPTPSVCELCGCSGCLPAEAYAPDDSLLPEYRNIRPGEWSLHLPSSMHPVPPCPGLSKKEGQ